MRLRAVLILAVLAASGRVVADERSTPPAEGGFWGPTPPLAPGVVRPCSGRPRCYVVCREPFVKHVEKHFALVPALRDHDDKTVRGLRAVRGPFREVGVGPMDVLLRLGSEKMPTDFPNDGSVVVPIPDVRRAFAVGTRDIVVERSEGGVLKEPAERVRIRLHIRECAGRAAPKAATPLAAHLIPNRTPCAPCPCSVLPG